MSPMQILVLVLFGTVTWANTFVIQPDISWSPMYHALVVSTDVTLFWVALNLQRFGEMGRKAEITPPAAPIDAVPPVLDALPAAEPVVQEASTARPVVNTSVEQSAHVIPAPIVTQPPAA